MLGFAPEGLDMLPEEKKSQNLFVLGINLFWGVGVDWVLQTHILSTTYTKSNRLSNYILGGWVKQIDHIPCGVHFIRWISPKWLYY